LPHAGVMAPGWLVKDWGPRAPFELRARAGFQVCAAMARRGVLTRPIGDVVVLMPPYCSTPAQLRRMVRTLREALREIFREGTRQGGYCLIALRATAARRMTTFFN